MRLVKNTGPAKPGSSGLGSPHTPHGLRNSTTVTVPAASVTNTRADDGVSSAGGIYMAAGTDYLQLW